MVNNINERIWKNSCVNNASTLLQGSYNTEYLLSNKTLVALEVLDLAKEIHNACYNWVQGSEEE